MKAKTCIVNVSNYISAKKFPKGEQNAGPGAATGRRITEADQAPRSAPNCCK